MAVDRRRRLADRRLLQQSGAIRRRRPALPASARRGRRARLAVALADTRLSAAAATSQASLRGDRARESARAGDAGRAHIHANAGPGPVRRQPHLGTRPAPGGPLPAAARGPHGQRPPRQRPRPADRPQTPDVGASRSEVAASRSTRGTRRRSPRHRRGQSRVGRAATRRWGRDVLTGCGSVCLLGRISDLPAQTEPKSLESVDSQAADSDPAPGVHASSCRRCRACADGRAQPRRPCRGAARLAEL